MSEWIYGVNENVWAMWSKTDLSNRYGVNYVFGDWDEINEKMYLKVVFYDHSPLKEGKPAGVGYVTLGPFDWNNGEP